MLPNNYHSLKLGEKRCGGTADRRQKYGRSRRREWRHGPNGVGGGRLRWEMALARKVTLTTSVLSSSSRCGGAHWHCVSANESCSVVATDASQEPSRTAATRGLFEQDFGNPDVSDAPSNRRSGSVCRRWMGFSGRTRVRRPAPPHGGPRPLRSRGDVRGWYDRGRAREHCDVVVGADLVYRRMW